MNDLLMLLIILLLLLILISSLGGSITVAPRYEGEMFSANKKRKNSSMQASMQENFSEKKSKSSNKSRSKKLGHEHFTTNNHVNSQDCVQTKVVGLCDGPCDGGHGQRKVDFKTLKNANGGGKACLAPTTEACINHTPCPVKANKEHFQEEKMGFEAMDNSYGLAPF